MDMFNTEITTEILLFSVDAIFSVIILKSYNNVKKYINCLQEVTSKGESDKLLAERTIGENNEPKYVMIKGPVKALGSTISSIYSPNVSGVVQRLSTCELVMKRNSSGIWWDESRPINTSYNAVPFAIVLDKCLVQVQDALMADELHLDFVYNKYDRTVHTLAGNLWSYFFGVRQYGVQTTEEMLKENTIVTCIGNLLRGPDGSWSLVAPSEGKPYMITTQSVTSLLQKLRDKKSLFGALLTLTGGLTLFFGVRLARRFWTSIKKRKEKEELQRRLESGRRQRRQNARNFDDLPDSLKCVVCQENPKEVIMLPCGHLCVCEDCSERLGLTCPICRAHVQTKAAAFVS